MPELTILPKADAVAQVSTSPLALLDRAIAQGASIETLERLMAMSERYEAAQARREFDEAISAAKAEIRPIVKNRSVGFDNIRGGGRTDYAYEDLAMISGTVDPVLSRHGLSYRYSAKQDGMMLSVTCIMAHQRGHREETTLVGSNDNTGNKNSNQAIGSAATYLQRYTLKLALGLAVAPDTDGRTPADEPKQIDSAQFRYLQDLIESAGADEKRLLAHLKAESIETLNQAQYRTAEAALRKKMAQPPKPEAN